jgi:hypothetical protein
LRVDCMMEESVGRGEEDERLIVEAGKYHALEFHRKPL